MELYLIIGAVGVVLVLLSWYARGLWDQRKATLVPRLLDVATKAVAEATSLQQPDAVAAAADAVSTATIAAKTAALQAAIVSLKK